MLKEIIMPQMGATMTTGTVVAWLKNEGDRVEKGEPVLEIETDKVAIEVEALDSGILKKMVAGPGAEVPVTHVIGYIGDEDDEVPSELIAKGAESTDAPISEATARPQREMGLAKGKEEDRTTGTPVARKLASENGIDLRFVQGTGPEGRITKKDVLKAIEEKRRAPQDEASETTASQTPGPPRVAKVIPLTGLRKTIAKRLAESFRDTPHIVITMVADMTQAQNTRDSLLTLVEKQYGVRLSYTDLVVKASALALKEYPALNSSLVGEEIRVYQDVNIGLAVAIPTGLIVPTIFRADRLSLPEIAVNRKELVTKAQEESLSLDEVTGGTFTLSNLGMYGVESFSAVINPPQAAILATGAVGERAVVRDGQIAIRPQLTLSLSADHRVVDGVQSAQFLARVRGLLENPSLMLIPS